MPSADYMLTATGAEIARHLMCGTLDGVSEWVTPCGGPGALACVFGVILNITFICAAVKLLEIAVRYVMQWRERAMWKILVSIAVAGISYCGMTKHGRVSVDDPYIVDAGSYVTNDYVHVAVAARFDFIPSDLEILIYSRELSLSNAEDWVQLTRAEEGPYRLRESPLDIAFPNATNYDFLVAANYIPPPTVHTNGVWQIKGFVIPGTATNGTTGRITFPRTIVRDMSVRDVEYIGVGSSVGPYIDTGYVWQSNDIRIECDFVKTGSANGMSGLFGSQKTGRDTNWGIQAWHPSSGYGLQHYIGNSPRVYTWSTTQNIFYKFIGETTSSNTWTIIVNGDVHTGTWSGSVCDDVTTIGLFTLSNSFNLEARRTCNVNVYAFRLIDNGVLVRDLIPKRFRNERGQSEGAMYDRVSGQLFRNQGTGMFIIGPDK